MEVYAQKQDGGISNFATGVLTSNGEFTDVVCGFVPRYVKWVNLTDRIVDEKFAEMGSTETLMTAAAGTMTLQTGSRIVFATIDEAGFGGFSVIEAASLAGKVYHFIAFG